MERLENKKIVIYGDERYTRDFLYVFDKIKPDYVVDDKKSKYSEEWHALEKENQEQVFVIVCKFNERNAIKNLNSIGYKRNVNYASATTFFKELDFPVKGISEKRRIYVWGTGVNSYEFFQQYVEKNPDVEIVGCVDSDEKKQGNTFFGRSIYLPEEIIKSDKDAFFVIATKKNYWECKNTLLKFGKEEKKDFVFYLEINQYASSMMYKTVYDIPKVDYICNKVFSVLLSKPEGKTIICGGMNELPNTPLYYSEIGEVWHSNIMKVMRLSIINGTYSFCNPEGCSYIECCGKQEIDVNELCNSFRYSQEKIKCVSHKKANMKTKIFHIENYILHEDNFPTVFECGWDETCNLYCTSCRRCIHSAGIEKKRELSAFSNRIKHELILPYVKRLNVAGLGEAFASDIYKKIIFDKEIAEKVKNLGVLSNGELFTKKNCDKLISTWDTVSVFISMDGATKQTAEKLRRGIHFERWMENMKYIGEMRNEGKIKDFAFNFVVQRENYREMPDFVKICIGFHADHIKFGKIFNWGTYTDEEFEQITMFQKNGEMKKELAEVLNADIFKRPEVHLFEWINWEERYL